ncbi:MAG: hypothetical protein Q6J46_08610 [Thermostichus sp. DG02_2_bins_29]
MRLVKRITAINGSPIPGYVNLPGDPNDEAGIPWPGGAESFLQGSVSQAVRSGSRVEFSIYFLLNSPAATASLCDPLAAGFSYVPGSLSLGFTGQPVTNLSDAQDGDRGAFIAPGLPVPAECGGIPNPNGVVVVNLTGGTSGLIRFEVTGSN